LKRQAKKYIHMAIGNEYHWDMESPQMTVERYYKTIEIVTKGDNL